MMCSAWLSWRSPPRSSRWRSRCPEEQGIGAVRVWRAKLASLALRAGGPADHDGGGQRPTAGLCEQLRAVRPDQRKQLALERVRLAGQHAQLRDLLARAAHPSAGGLPAQAPVTPIELARLLERAALDRALKLWAELEQMPAQPVLHAGALGDEIPAVIADQPDLHRFLIEMGGGEALHPVLDHGAGDRERVDLVRLARLALPAPGGAHPARRYPYDPLAGREQRLLEPPRDVPAVLDRPHPLVIEPARPAHRGQMPRLLGLDLARAAHPTGSLVDGRQRVRALVRVRPDHDHLHRPFVIDHRRSGSPADSSHSGRLPRSYQVTPKVLGRRRATQPSPVRQADDTAV